MEICNNKKNRICLSPSLCENNITSRIKLLGKTLIAKLLFQTIIIIVTNEKISVSAFSCVSSKLSISPITCSPIYYESLRKERYELYSVRESDTISEFSSEVQDVKIINDPLTGVNANLMHQNTENFAPKKNGKNASKNGKSLPQAAKKTKIINKNAQKKRLWIRRHARTIEEGIRNEKIKYSSRIPFLSKILAPNKTKRYGARTIMGLIMALAEEAQGLEVEVDAKRNSPISNKHIDSIRINFSRLGFKPIQMGAYNDTIRDFNTAQSSLSETKSLEDISSNIDVATVDEVFDRIDIDNSGALDTEELAKALDIALDGNPDGFKYNGKRTRKERVPKKVLTGLASRLVSLYDINGDKELDRNEYQNMVEDMAMLRKTTLKRSKSSKTANKGEGSGILAKVFGKRSNDRIEDQSVQRKSEDDMKGASTQKDAYRKEIDYKSAINVTDSDEFFSSVTGEGSIVLTDLKIDLRRLIFGAFPIVNKITPGGPLVLEPFTATVSGSFNADDIMDSFLLKKGLRLLVARVLRRRVRSFRDLVDGAVFYGRTWNRASKSAPIVEVPEITSIEFDEKNRAIISGIANIQSSPNAPFIENGFKLRTKVGTRENGQIIRLKDPEVALVLECPKAWERNIVSVCNKLSIPIPKRPDPIYTYIPLISPLKKNDKDGYNMGDDNCLKSINIKDGSLQVVMSSVLRPGRFLGNHYIAFTVPNRSVIVTMDRLRNGIRVARRNKREKDLELKLAQEKAAANELGSNIINKELDVLRFQDSDEENRKKLKEARITSLQDTKEGKGFFNRFITGYINASISDKKNEQRKARLFSAISEWFGRQHLGDYFDDDW